MPEEPADVPKLIDPDRIAERTAAPWLVKAVFRVAEPLFQIPAMNALYAGASRRTAETGNPFAAGLEELDVRYKIVGAGLEVIPRSGPLFVVANHPFGGVDGGVLGDILMRTRREDFRILLNYLLLQMPELEPFSIAIDPFARKSAARTNAEPMRRAIRWLRSGHALATFPAGWVSHYRSDSGIVEDPPWNENVAALIHRTRATTIPLYFPGQNSRLFQLAGRVHPRLRTLLLPRETLRRRGNPVRVVIGDPVEPAELDPLPDHASRIRFLRSCVYALRTADA